MSDARMLEAVGARQLEGSGYLALEAPPSALASYTDNFTYADSSVLTTVAPTLWATINDGQHVSPHVLSGHIKDAAGVVDNAAQFIPAMSRHHYAQADVVAAAGCYPGVLTRCHNHTGTAPFNASNWLRLTLSPAGDLELYSHLGSGGGWTFVNSVNVGTTTGTIRLQSVGYDHTAYFNGVSKFTSTVTLSSFADGQPGIYIYQGGGTLDNFVAGELTPPTYPSSDDFNRADTTPRQSAGAGLGTNWVDDFFYVKSNGCHRSGGGNDFARFLYDLGSPDHYVEADILAGWSGFYVSINARGQPTDYGSACYLGFMQPGGSVAEIGKVDTTGGYTTIATNTVSTSTAAYRARLEVQGTAIRYYRGGTLVCSTTDSSITTGNHVGVNLSDPGAGNQDTVGYDNFTCGTI